MLEMFKQLHSKAGFRSIKFRLLSYILLCSTIFAIVITGIQLAWDFREDVSLIENNFTQIEESFLQPIATSLWNLDSEQVEVQVEGIINLPNMQYVLVKEMLGRSEVPLVVRGKVAEQYDIQQTFSLIYQGELVGTLMVAASLEQVYNRLIERSVVILVSQTIKTLLVSFLILLIISHVVIRHIARMSDYARKLDLDNLDTTLKLEGRSPNSPGKKDELDALAYTLNEMGKKLRIELQARLSANELLAHEQDFSKTVINASNAVIVTLDPELLITNVNPAGIMLTGYSQTEMEGKKWAKLFCSEDKREQIESELLSRRVIEDREVAIEDLAGHQSILLWSFVPFYENSQVVKIIGFGHDVTKLKLVQKQYKELNESLESIVSERTESLEKTNQQLVEAFDELKQTQTTLIESEKMASLGNLVAGVAHEINTPIGISVTAGSFLQELSKQLRKKVAEQKLSRAFLNEVTDNLDESSNLLLNNLRRASELIGSFKQVAVDQASESCYNFNVKDNLEQVITSLHHKIKRCPCEVEIDCDPHLTNFSYPGCFTQIYSNLILNSINHAFDNWEGEKKISITIKLVNRFLQIDYRDSGRGIEPEILAKIFEPFVTSKRGKGGSGLGTHIIYNLVVQMFKGTITCESQLGQGSHFQLLLPFNEVVNQENKTVDISEPKADKAEIKE